MGAWADRAFDLLKDKEGDEHVRLQRDAQIRHQILTYAPNLWTSLRVKLTQEIRDFGELRPGYLSITDNAERISLSSPQCDVDIEFSQKHPQVTYKAKRKPNATSTASTDGTFSCVVKDQTVYFRLESGAGTTAFDKTGQPLTVDEVAEFLLNKLI